MTMYHLVSKSLMNLKSLGCDSTSVFQGKGKATMLKALENNPEFIPLFQKIGSSFNCSDGQLKELQKFVCRIYKVKDCEEVNAVCYNLFKLSKFCEKSIPCTLDALKKHST